MTKISWPPVGPPCFRIPPNHPKVRRPYAPNSTFDISKLLVTTSWFPSSWAQTSVSPRHSSSSFILGGTILTQLQALGVSLSLMVPPLPRSSVFIFILGPVFCLFFLSMRQHLFSSHSRHGLYSLMWRQDFPFNLISIRSTYALKLIKRNT